MLRIRNRADEDADEAHFRYLSNSPAAKMPMFSARRRQTGESQNAAWVISTNRAILFSYP